MKYGVSTLMKGTVEEFFDKARNSFEAVEIVCDSPYRRPLEVNTEFLRSVKRSLSIEYSVHCPFTDADIGAVDDSVRGRSVDGVLEAIEVASIIGAPIVVVHPARGSRGSLEERDRVKGLEKESLARIHEFAVSRETRICLENMPSGLPFAERSLASGVMHLAKGLAGAGITFDVGHANTTTVAAEKMLRHLGNLTSHVHVHDNAGSLDEHLEVGLGTVNWPAVVRGLVELRFEGILMDESLNVEAARRGINLLKRIEQEATGREACK
ncbi:MAG: sugar phosphate isomerase/epimerase family protein [Candidatus Eisenbacteria bacterium]